MREPDCFVCRKHREETGTPGGPIFQDDLLYAGHVAFPAGEGAAYLGHLRVEPGRHAPRGDADAVDALCLRRYLGAE